MTGSILMQGSLGQNCNSRIKQRKLGRLRSRNSKRIGRLKEKIRISQVAVREL